MTTTTTTAAPRRTLSASDLYPIVQDLTHVEYGCCCDGPGISLEDILPPEASPTSVTTKTCDETTKNNKKSSLFRRKSSKNNNESGSSWMDVSDSQTISTEDEGTKFEEAYVLTRQIFRCSVSVVWECVHRESGRLYCVKIFDRLHEQRDLVLHEIDMLQSVQGTNVVKLVQVLEDGAKLYMVMDLVTGGNLLSRVVQEDGLPEDTVRDIAISLLQGVRNLHERGVGHNALEPSNILLQDDQAQICDFGHAAQVGARRCSETTTPYTAPEVGLGYECDSHSDMWSVGMILYFCLIGHTPTSDKSMNNNPRTFDYSMTNNYEKWNQVSRYAKQLISGLLHADPMVRLTADEALAHPWLAAVQPTTADKHKTRVWRRRLSRQLSKLRCRKQPSAEDNDATSWSTLE